MLRHPDIWKAIDRLAAKHGLSASGLARRAGLDPTTFNKSKRVTAEGRPRWPNTESLSRILEVTGTDPEEFLAGDGQPRGHRHRIAPAGTGGENVDLREGTCHGEPRLLRYR